LLSVLVLVHNESTTLETLLKLVLAVAVDKEVIVVDDGSTEARATCYYKVLRASLLKSLPLRCERCEFCREVTALIARGGPRPRAADLVSLPHPRPGQEDRLARRLRGALHAAPVPLHEVTLPRSDRYPWGA
jgi:cellulose synthase/poly-beta-1,6-N-acetylglucosamine synthase-like glycosyltransferase